MMRCPLAFLALSLVLPAAIARSAQTKPSPATSAASSAIKKSADACEQKIQSIKKNAQQPAPDQRPTVLTEDEVNAYFADGRVALPAGVKGLRLQGQPRVITAETQVDFDQLTASRRSSNPLMAVFTGLHDVRVVAHASGAGGQGEVRIDSMAIDNVTLPRFVLSMFVEKFITPRYPNVGLDSHFKMPARVDVATVGERRLTVTQK